MTEPPDIQKILRKPFPPELVGAKPRINCRDCSQAQGRVCNQHTKVRCSVCKQWITNAHMHLSFVNHALVTDRLLDVDQLLPPEQAWDFGPAYHDVDPQVLIAACASGNPEIVAMVIDNSPPLIDSNGGMWSKLTINGVTRLGYAYDEDTGPEHNKKLISDGIKVTGMRFGLALELWSKEGLGVDSTPPEAPDPNRPFAESMPNGPGTRDWIAEFNACTDLETLLKLGQECHNAGAFVGAVYDAGIRRRQELTPHSATT